MVLNALTEARSGLNPGSPGVSPRCFPHRFSASWLYGIQAQKRKKVEILDSMRLDLYNPLPVSPSEDFNPKDSTQNSWQNVAQGSLGNQQLVKLVAVCHFLELGG